METLVANARLLDTALRVPGADGDAAAAAFCAAAAPARSSAPGDSGVPSALRWCAGVLHRGVPEHGAPAEVKGAVFVVGVALQVLLSCSGADHRQQFGHVARDGSHLRWPVRGAALVRTAWTPDVDAPTGVVPALLRLARSRAGGPQTRLRALQVLGSLARDDDALPTMIDAGCRARCAEALAARPRPGLTDAETKEFICARETWQFLDERVTSARAETTTNADQERADVRPSERASPTRSDPPPPSGDPPPSEALAGASLEPRGDGDKNNPAASSPDEASAASTRRTSSPTISAQQKSRRVAWRLAPELGERPASASDFSSDESASESSSAPGWRGCMVRVVSRSRPDLAGALGFATGLAGSDRVEVLVDPLRFAGPRASASSTALFFRRDELTVIEGEGLRLEDVRGGRGNGVGRPGEVAAGERAEAEAFFEADEEAEEAEAEEAEEASDKSAAIEQSAASADRDQSAASAARSQSASRSRSAARLCAMLDAAAESARGGSFAAAAEGFERALAFAEDAFDAASLAVAHCRYHAWFSRAALAGEIRVPGTVRGVEEEPDAGSEEESDSKRKAHRAKAATHAAGALDALEFRGRTERRDGQRSLFELDESERALFARRFFTRGGGEGREDMRDQAWTFLGAPLAVTLARDWFLARLLERAHAKTARRVRRADASGDGGGPEGTGPNDAGGGADAGNGADAEDASADLVPSDAECYHRVLFALRAVESAARLGCLSADWRASGADDAGSVALSVTDSEGFAAPAATPRGTHAAYLASRDAFLRGVRALVAAEAFASAENPAAALASREGRERAILDAARTNPLAMRVAAFASK